MNYGEELAYWYLRLNGFFPITNFVLHRSENMPHNSDVDVLAVRPPYVFEAVGGNSWDWDRYLTEYLDFNITVGIICEVKTGDYRPDRLFPDHCIDYSLDRLGLVPQDRKIWLVDQLKSRSAVTDDNICIAKLFISQTESQSDCYLNRTIEQLETFLEDRVRRYPIEKFGARMFFSSSAFQTLIDRVHRSIRQDSAT